MMPSWLPGALSTGMGIGSSILDSRSRRAHGRLMRQSAEFEAGQLEVNAGQEMAMAQRRAMEERRRADLVSSRALALSAASGGATDPSVLDIIGNIEGEGAYRALTSIYEGEERARQFRTAAAARRWEGAAAENASRGNMFGTLLRGGATLLSKYGGNGPPTAQPYGTASADPYGGWMEWGT